MAEWIDAIAVTEADTSDLARLDRGGRAIPICGAPDRPCGPRLAKAGSVIGCASRAAMF